MAKIQIFAPHQDDDGLFMGGTLLKHYAEKDDIQIIAMTNGELGTKIKSLQGKIMSQIRKAELLERLRQIPGINLRMLDFPDGKLKRNEEATKMCLKEILAWEADIIYLPECNKTFSYYQHPDHLETGELVAASLNNFSKKIELRFYHSRQYNLLIDVSTYFKKAQRALDYYKSQAKFSSPFPYLIQVGKLMRIFYCRWWGLKKGCQYAEAFRSVIYKS